MTASLFMPASVVDTEKGTHLFSSRPTASSEGRFRKISASPFRDTFDHPDQRRYPGQRIHAVAIEGCVYLVPFVESDEEVFLKTVIPSRKAMKRYRGEIE